MNKLSAKSRGMKFDLGDKVKIRSLWYQEGVITGWKWEGNRNGQTKFSYDVRYVATTNLYYEEVGAVEYFPLYQINTFLESDLEEIEGLDDADKLARALAKQIKGDMGDTVVNRNYEMTGLSKLVACEHKWASYERLVEKFYYCTECDEKRK